MDRRGEEEKRQQLLRLMQVRGSGMASHDNIRHRILAEEHSVISIYLPPTMHKIIHTVRIPHKNHKLRSYCRGLFSQDTIPPTTGSQTPCTSRRRQTDWGQSEVHILKLYVKVTMRDGCGKSRSSIPKLVTCVPEQPMEKRGWILRPPPPSFPFRLFLILPALAPSFQSSPLVGHVTPNQRFPIRLASCRNAIGTKGWCS